MKYAFKNRQEMEVIVNDQGDKIPGENILNFKLG